MTSLLDPECMSTGFHIKLHQESLWVSSGFLKVSPLRDRGAAANVWESHRSSLMYSDTMFTFAAAADKLDLTIAGVLDILGLTVDDAERENLTVDEIIEAVNDCCDCDDYWTPGCDSIASHCESYSYN